MPAPNSSRPTRPLARRMYRSDAVECDWSGAFGDAAPTGVSARAVAASAYGESRYVGVASERDSGGASPGPTLVHGILLQVKTFLPMHVRTGVVLCHVPHAALADQLGWLPIIIGLKY